jgi:hypothetical protein
MGCFPSRAADSDIGANKGYTVWRGRKVWNNRAVQKDPTVQKPEGSGRAQQDESHIVCCCFKLLNDE